MYNDTSDVNRFVAYKNPIRYRSYYYDFETNLYYLNSRYYDPEIGRFINADDIKALDATKITINGLNLYVYCLNNPVNSIDDDGNMPKWLAWLISGVSIIAGVILTATGVGGVLGGVLISAGVGSLINGYINEASGGSFGAGWVGGLVSGALCGLGAGFAGSLMLAATNIVGMASVGLAVSGVAVSFALGTAGNMLGSWLTSAIDNKRFDAMSTFKDSLVLGILNVFAGFGSGMANAAFNAGAGAAYKVLTTIITMSTEGFYDIFSYLYQILSQKVWNKATT